VDGMRGLWVFLDNNGACKYSRVFFNLKKKRRDLLWEKKTTNFWLWVMVYQKKSTGSSYKKGLVWEIEMTL
jgi:hypothetical protein